MWRTHIALAPAFRAQVRGRDCMRTWADPARPAADARIVGRGRCGYLCRMGGCSAVEHGGSRYRGRGPYGRPPARRYGWRPCPGPGRLKAARTGGSGFGDRAGRREESRLDRAVVASRLGQDLWLVPGSSGLMPSAGHAAAAAGANGPRLISDEDIQRFRLDKVTPHSAPITLAGYDPDWPVFLLARLLASAPCSAVSCLSRSVPRPSGVRSVQRPCPRADSTAQRMAGRPIL
jgi:hypothetical protein